MGRRLRYRLRLSAPEPLSGVLDRAGEDRFARKKAPIPESIWRETVGLRNAERTKPESLARGVLVVRAATSVWAHELSFLSDLILERLQSRGIAVNELRFRVAAVDPPNRPAQPTEYRKVPPPARLPPELVESLAHVDDADLRTSIEHAARSNLAWQEFVGKRSK